MSFKIKNIWEHFETTIIAIVIFVATFYFVDQGKATFSEVWPAWAAVIYFTFTGKPNIKPPAAAMLLILFISSCTPQKRLARLVKHHPELEYTIHDTVRIDTNIVYAPPKEIFSIPISPLDTFHFTGVNYNFDFYRTQDTFYIQVQALPDTIYIFKEIPLQYSSINIAPPTPNKFKTILIYLTLFIGVLMVLYIIIKAFQR